MNLTEEQLDVITEEAMRPTALAITNLRREGDKWVGDIRATYGYPGMEVVGTITLEEVPEADKE